MLIDRAMPGLLTPSPVLIPLLQNPTPSLKTDEPSLKTKHSDGGTCQMELKHSNGRPSGSRHPALEDGQTHETIR